MTKYIAAYLRLSRDDDDKGDESNSISSQRSIIINHISTVDELYNVPIIEFVDDGYSGTNFDRPGISKLLEAVRRGEIRCIVVKDLSRFGRTYLEVCKYIEVIFPYLDVRFISINDYYDSNNHKGTTADVDVAFRNLINAIYSKDISKKVKSAKLTKIRQGMNVNAFTPYGYKKSDADKHKLVIDVPAATVVKRIFEMFCDGHTPTEIARTLNTEGILTPSEYKKKIGSNLKILSTTGTLWSNGIVNNILHNEQYLGNLVCGRVYIDRVGGKKILYRPKEDWIRIPGAHPAIITREMWNMVYSIKSKANFGNRKKPNTNRFLFKKIRCGYCGHILRYREESKKSGEGEYRYYYCETPRLTDEYGCTNKSYNPLEIESIIKSVVRTQIALMLDMERVCNETKDSINKSSESAKKSIRLLDNEIDRINASKQQIYECYRLGKIDTDEYIKQREEVEVKVSTKKEDREKLISKGAKQADDINNVHRFFASFMKYQNETDPSAELVNALIESVFVYSMEKIEVRFKFRDELESVENQMIDIMSENK